MKILEKSQNEELQNKLLKKTIFNLNLLLRNKFQIQLALIKILNIQVKNLVKGTAGKNNQIG